MEDKFCESSRRHHVEVLENVNSVVYLTVEALETKDLKRCHLLSSVKKLAFQTCLCVSCEFEEDGA
jgi:hypothetical protein